MRRPVPYVPGRRPRRRLAGLLARSGAAAVALSLAGSLVAAGGAQAVVVSDGGVQAGVALMPNARTGVLPAGVSPVGGSGSCTDPWLTSDFGGPTMPGDGLCYGGGAVMHSNETFALTWDQHRAYWSQTRGYVEQYLRDVADSSSSLGSPFALTTQYSDAGGRAQNRSLFGGGCIDYGAVGGSACDYGNVAGVGHNFPVNGCAPVGYSLVRAHEVAANSTCLTDAQVQAEVSQMYTQAGIEGRTQPGYTPLVMVLLPPGVETCLDPNHELCSANAQLTAPPAAVSSSDTGGVLPAGTYGIKVAYAIAGGASVASSAQSITTSGSTSTITIASPAPAPDVTGWYAYVTGPNGSTYMQQGAENAIGSDVTLTTSPVSGPTPTSDVTFCSYHSLVNVSGTDVNYVVQPWTAGTGCDEPDVPAIASNPLPSELSVAVGQRLVSPLSQATIASIVNPHFNGWASLAGSEIDDNGGCAPLGEGLDKVTLGSSQQNPYYLQREFNNAYELQSDPFTYFGCAPQVDLSPAFVAPNPVNQGEEVQFDGSVTASTLAVPSRGYVWSFGDGSAGTGPSVVHVYAKPGTYTVTLTATDRGANTRRSTEQITVLGPNGVPGAGGSGGSGTGAPTKLSVHLQIIPESLHAFLTRGLTLRVTANGRADGIVALAISRSAAQHAGIATGSGSVVVIGRGTVSGQIRSGTVYLHIGLSSATAAKLSRLAHVTVDLSLSLAGTGGQRLQIVAAAKF